jgi:MFS family permease
MQQNKAFQLLKKTRFRNFILARLLSTFAFNFLGLLISWYVYQLTHNYLDLGLVGLAEAIPFIITCLFSGPIIDKSSRRNVMFLSLLGYTLCALSLFYLSANQSMELNTKLNLIYASIFITGICRGFLSPSIVAYVGQLLDKEDYVMGTTINSTTWQIGAVAGPAIAGIMYAYAGVEFSFMVCCILLFASCITILFLPRFSYPKPKESFMQRLKQGIVFVYRKKVLLSAFTLDMFAVLFGGVTAILPVFASDVLHVGSEGLGLLRAAPAIGAVMMALMLTYFPLKHNVGNKLLISIALFGLCMLGFALSTFFWLSFVLLLLSGAFDNISVVIRQTIVQVFTPDRLKGRVSAVNSVFIGSSNEIGAFESGLAAKVLGLIPSVLFGGSMTLIVVGLVKWKAPSLRNLSISS